MDLEQEMQDLLREDDYLGKMICQLSELKYRKGYDGCAKDVEKLLEELKDRKDRLQESLNELVGDIIMFSDALSGRQTSEKTIVDEALLRG